MFIAITIKNIKYSSFADWWGAATKTTFLLFKKFPFAENFSLFNKNISDDKYKGRLIFDGYPRNLTQAVTLTELLNKYGQKVDLVLKLSVSLETIKKRILERRTLEKRADDSEEIAVKRYKTYEKSTEPVIDYYKKLNLLKVVDGERSIDQINKEISDIISLI